MTHITLVIMNNDTYNFEIDFSKVNSIEDIKTILETFELSFTGEKFRDSEKYYFLKPSSKPTYDLKLPSP